MSKKSSPKPPRILQVRKDGAYDCVYVNSKKIRLDAPEPQKPMTISGKSKFRYSPIPPYPPIRIDIMPPDQLSDFLRPEQVQQ